MKLIKTMDIIVGKGKISTIKQRVMKKKVLLVISIVLALTMCKKPEDLK